MSQPVLPPRASLEYLRKLAKDRLAELRRANPDAQLATALLSVAQEHGFSSWRALKAELDRRQATEAARFFEAIASRDSETVRALLRAEPSLIRARHERHDATPLHHAAGCGDLATMRVLLEAGADPNDAQDDARLGVIGWAAFFPAAGAVAEVVSLLLERGARHHIFSAIAAGDLDAVRTLVEQRPESLDERLSRRYQGQTPLHFAIARRRVDILDLLLALGADVAAVDQNGQTALEYALLLDDGAAAARLRAAGAKTPQPQRATAEMLPAAAWFASSIQASTLVVGAKDVAATLAWYTSIGFEEVARFPIDEAVVFWGQVAMGPAALTFDVRQAGDASGVSLLITTDRVRELFDRLTSRRLEGADVQFVRTLHEPEHGGQEFSIRDPNGFTLRFLQPGT